MKHIILLITGLILVILVWIVIGYSYLADNQPATDPDVLQAGEKIIVGNAEIVPFKMPAEQKMSIQTKNGSTIEVNDIRQGSNLLSDGTYVLYESPDKTVRTFEIIYFEKSNFFQIVLDEKPLREMRVAAQLYLSNALGISSNELCSLNYSVKTTVYVDQNWAGAELGFENCPLAVDL